MWNRPVPKIFSFVFLILAFSSARAESIVRIGHHELRGAFVFDTQTKLTWARCSVGQKWASTGKCKESPKGYTFNAAQRLSNTNWRVPTKSELDSLFFPSGSLVKIDTRVFPMSSNRNQLYWSNEQVDDSSAWYADFNTGSTDRYYGDYDFLNEKFFVRLVKN